MYHPSLFVGIPKELGVYVLRRTVEPYFPRTGTRTVKRVAVVGYSGIVRQTLVQYFCEHTRTAMTSNIRNVAMAIREQITHIDCYFEPDIIGDDTVRARAFERVVTEEIEPMLRPPQDSDNIGRAAAELAIDPSFRAKVLARIGAPTHTIRLPNRDNIIADLLEQNQDRYGVNMNQRGPFTPSE